MYLSYIREFSFCIALNSIQLLIQWHLSVRHSTAPTFYVAIKFRVTQIRKFWILETPDAWDAERFPQMTGFCYTKAPFKTDSCINWLIMSREIIIYCRNCTNNTKCKQNAVFLILTKVVQCFKKLRKKSHRHKWKFLDIKKYRSSYCKKKKEIWLQLVTKTH